MSRLRYLALGILTACALITVPATAALADQNPTPTPTESISPVDDGTGNIAPDFGYNPTPAPVQFTNFRFLRPEQFSVSISTFNNSVYAFGPVHFSNARDITVTPFLDRFSDRFSLRSVRVLHAQLPLPTVNLAACTVNFAQFGAPWVFAGGTGAYFNATGHGRYSLFASFRFPFRGGFCSLSPLFVNPFQLRADIQNGGAGLPPIRSFRVSVNGSGVASR
jgi:hypothetical protein